MSFTSAYIFTTNRCNLDCSYCYEKDRSGDMPEETMKRTIDWLVGQRDATESASSDQDISLTFFGGEPLLNFKVVKYGIEYTKEIHEKTGIRFGLYVLTNGTVLTDEMYDFFKVAVEWKFNPMNLQVSMDGCRESHDKNRVFKGSGCGSFDLVAKNVKRFREIFSQLIVRQTVTPGNMDSLSKDFKTLLESGGVTASLSPAVEGDWNSEVVKKYCDELDKCVECYMGHSDKMYFNYLHGTIQRMENNTFNSYHGCRAGRKMVGITVDGDIYPCHRFISYKNSFDYKLGNVYGGGVEYSGGNWKKLNDMFQEVDSECKSCESITCNKCYATNLFINNSAWKRPKNGFCDMNQAVTKMLKSRILNMILESKLGINKGELVTMEDNKKIAINTGEGTEVCEDYQDLISRCLVKLVNENRATNERLSNIERHLGINRGEAKDRCSCGS